MCFLNPALRPAGKVTLYPAGENGTSFPHLLLHGGRSQGETAWYEHMFLRLGHLAEALIRSDGCSARWSTTAEPLPLVVMVMVVGGKGGGILGLGGGSRVIWGW